MDKLQIGIIGGAVILVVIAILIITGILPGLKTGQDYGVNIIMWGFEDESSVRNIALKYAEAHQNFELKYVQKTPANFENDLLNTIARGGSDVPDVVVFPSDYLKKHSDKLSVAPPIIITEREIRQNFIDAASVFLTGKNEVLAIPFYADPLVLYWNNDMFIKKSISLPPKTWDEFLDDASKLTEKDSSGNIVIAGAALGRAMNIKHAELILATLFLQSGDKIIDENGEATLGNPVNIGNTTLQPAESALRFVVDFANPQKVSQSWSAALPEAEDMFISSKLGMYLGTVSEYNQIKNKNTHLNFSVGILPQLAGAARPVTGGTLFGLAVPRASLKQAAAWNFISFLTNTENSASRADKTNMVSVRRDILPAYKKESVRSVFADSILSLELWPNPDPSKTNQIFSDIIEDVALGRATLRDSLEKSKARLNEK